MKNILAIVCLTIICNSLSAQNFQPGSVVTLAGEALTGEIAYKNWKKTPKKIQFRKDKGSAGVYYGVNDISSFSVSGDMYKRGVVEITERSDNINQVNIGDSFSSRTDTVFLLSVVSGPKSLYYYTDNVDHFYITNDDGSFEWLTFKKFKVMDQKTVVDQSIISDNENYVATNKGYINQLRVYFTNCYVVSDNLKYEVDDLRRAFLSYYDCTGKGPEYIQKSESNKLEISLLAGATYTSFKINTSTYDLIGKVNYSPSYSVTAGGAFDIVFPRQRGRISLNNELAYSSYKTEGQYHYNPNQFINEEYTYEFQYAYVKMNNMLRYKFFLNNLIIFVNGGVSNGFVVDEVNKYTKVRTYNGEKTTSTGKAFEGRTRSHELGLIAGSGLRINRASLEFRFERGMGPFNTQEYSAKVDRYSAMLGFRLK